MNIQLKFKQGIFSPQETMLAVKTLVQGMNQGTWDDTRAYAVVDAIQRNKMACVTCRENPIMEILEQLFVVTVIDKDTIPEVKKVKRQTFSKNKVIAELRQFAENIRKDGEFDIRGGYGQFMPKNVATTSPEGIAAALDRAYDFGRYCALRDMASQIEAGMVGVSGNE